MATLTLSDLAFIHQQILIAEAHAAGTPLTDLVTNPFLSLGLRTVDGSYNNLVAGQSGFGAADWVGATATARSPEAVTTLVETDTDPPAWISWLEVVLIEVVRWSNVR